MRITKQSHIFSRRLARLAIIILFFSFATAIHAQSRTKHVLLVTSYLSIDPLNENTYRGIREILDHSGIKVNYESFQLGVRHQPGLTVGNELVNALQKQLASRIYDLIITNDNDAADLFLRKRVSIPGNTPLLIGGYYGTPEPELQQELNMTAILTPFHSGESMHLGRRLFPKLKNIVLITDATASGRRQRELLLSQSSDDIAKTVTILDGTTYTSEELIRKITERSPDNTLLLFHSWGSAKESSLDSSYTILPRIRAIFPGVIFGSFYTYLPAGSDGGVVIDSQGQGRLIGYLAIRLLNGEKASAIPYGQSHMRSVLNHDVIRRHQVLPGKIPAGVELINEPPDFLVRHRTGLAIGGSIAFILLGGIVIFLFLRHREQKKATVLLNNLPLRVFIFNRKGKILYSHVPDPVEGVMKKSPKHLEELPPMVIQPFQRSIQKAFEEKKKDILDFEVQNQFRHVEFFYLGDDNPFHTEVVMSVSQNVTELYKAHRKTNRLLEWFRLTLESIGDGVITTDCDENVTMLNPTAAKLTGYSSEEAAGKKLDEIFRIVSYINGEKVPSSLCKAIETNRTVELANHTDLIAKDGTRRHIADCASPIRDEAGNITGGVLVFRDVTQEYEKRDQLRMNSAILETIEQIADIGHFRCSATGEILVQAPEKYWPRQNGKSLHPKEWINEKHLADFLEEWQKLLTLEIEKLSISFSAGTPERYFELRAMKSVDEISERHEYFGVIQDITNSRKSERLAQDNFQLLKNIMDNLPGYLFVKNVDNDFRYVMGNQKFCELTGQDSDNFSGKLDLEIFPLDEAAARKFREDDQRVVTSGEKLNIRERFVTAGGLPVVGQTVKTVITQSDGTRLLIGMGIDISREYELEQEQKRTIESLDYATRCERIINQSLSMITIEPDFDKAVAEMLRIIGENADADRAYIFRYTADDHRYASNEYEWVRPGISSQKALLQNIDMHEFPVWSQMLLDKQEILIPDMGCPPPELEEELKLLASQKIKSLLISGIWQNNQLLGFVGLDYTRGQHAFNDNSIHTVRSIANLFLLARERALQVEKIAETTLLQKQIVDNISIPIAIIDTEFRFQTANPSLLQQLGKSWDELRTQKCHEMLCRQEQPPPWCCLAREGADLKPHSRMVNKDGRSYIVNTQPIYDRNNKIRYALKSIIDITESNRQKVELQKALDQALAADRAKSYFFATMSHELRTPLNAVIGFSELLQDDDISREEQLDYLRSINCAGSALLNLINDVLDLSKLEADQLNLVLVETDMHRLLEDMISVFQLKARQKKISLTLQADSTRYLLNVDHLRIRQILLNLIGNAIKFTHCGGVTVRLEFTPSGKDDTGTLCIKVVDTGIGISEEQLKMIFDPFFQGESIRGNRIYEGSGLGLAISMRLAERMGGTIWVDSETGRGSTFALTMEQVKYKQLVAIPPPSNIEKPTPPPARRVLLVDDVPMNLKVLQALLRKLNIDSVCADSAAKALAILENDRDFTCILTDLWMPEMNGEQLADAVHNMPGAEQIAVIAVTADTEMKNNFSIEKFNDTLSKPVTLETLKRIFVPTEHII